MFQPMLQKEIKEDGLAVAEDPVVSALGAEEEHLAAVEEDSAEQDGAEEG